MAEAANSSSIGPNLDAVIDALARGGRADRVAADSRPRSVDARQEPSLGPHVAVSPLPRARTTTDAPVLPLDAPGIGGTSAAGGTNVGDAPGSGVERNAAEHDDVPGAARRVALDRRAGGAGEGDVPLDPVGTLPNPPPDAASTPAGDAAPWPASWPPALRRYVSAVLSRPEPPR